MNAEKYENKNWTKVCVIRGFYDDEGEYREEIMEDISLSELPREVVDRIAFDYQISILYSKRDVLVVARNKQNLDEYLQLEGRPCFFHGLLHRAFCDWYDGYTCIAAQLSDLRKLRDCAKKSNSNTDPSKR